MVALLQTSIPKSVELTLALEPELPWIEADPSQIQQVVMNLVINGAESIGPEGGWLRVSTRTVPAEKSDERPAGFEACMEVADSGSGMTEAIKARIFDPFFTTKFTGRGLGLAAMSGIVRAHEGRLQVDSEPGKGSTFRVFFPGVEKGAQKPRRQSHLRTSLAAEPSWWWMMSLRCGRWRKRFWSGRGIRSSWRATVLKE
jgi:signal transduction histidine kinase